MGDFLSVLSVIILTIEKNNVARHIEANHVEMTFQCNLCDKVTPTRHAMYYHKKKMHSGVI